MSEPQMWPASETARILHDACRTKCEGAAGSMRTLAGLHVPTATSWTENRPTGDYLMCMAGRAVRDLCLILRGHETLGC
eukprot:1854528-Amphidinium_carterae.1